MYPFLLHPFRYLSPYLSVSPFQLSLTLPFYCLRIQLVFSHHPSTSLRLISAILKIFFLTTIPDEGPSPKHHIININIINRTKDVVGIIIINSMKVLWDYFCLITHVVPSPFFSYHTTVCFFFFFSVPPPPVSIFIRCWPFIIPQYL